MNRMLLCFSNGMLPRQTRPLWHDTGEEFLRSEDVLVRSQQVMETIHSTGKKNRGIRI